MTIVPEGDILSSMIPSALLFGVLLALFLYPLSIFAKEKTTYTSEEKKMYIMDSINDFRASKSLQPLKLNFLACNFSKVRVLEIKSDFSHRGFYGRIKNNSLPYPNYKRVTENIARVKDFKRVVNKWITSPRHAAVLLRDTQYACVESSGNLYVFEGWKT